MPANKIVELLLEAIDWFTNTCVTFAGEAACNDIFAAWLTAFAAWIGRA